MTIRVSVREFLSSDAAALRGSADALFEHLNEHAKGTESIDLDFSEIRFISRSFAHSMEEALNELGKIVKVKLSNISDEVQQMINVVQQTKPIPYSARERSNLVPTDFDMTQEKDFF